MADEITGQYTFLVRVASWPGYAVGRTGGDTTATINKVYDGGEMLPDLVPGRRQTANLVLSYNWTPEDSSAMAAQYEPQVGRFTDDLSIQPCDADLSPTGVAKHYPGALLARWGQQTVNAQSDDPSSFEVEFAVRYSK